MRSIAILNQKGGVGKTTTAVNVAAALGQNGQRVLLLDLDPQSHASMHLGVDPGDGANMYDVLADGRPLAEATYEATDGLRVVPATIDLVGAEIELAGQEERETVLRRAVEVEADEFDVCVMDCAPSLGLLTVNALAAADEVIIPLQPHFLALQGLGRLLETVELVRERVNPHLRVAGIVLCMYETGTRLAQEVRDDVTRFMAAAEDDRAWHGARVFDTVIRRNIKLAECPSFGQTIFDYAPTSHGAADYALLAEEVQHARPAQAAPRSRARDEVVPPESATEEDATRADAPARDQARTG
jgi:chromosome partitioning protein